MGKNLLYFLFSLFVAFGPFSFGTESFAQSSVFPVLRTGMNLIPDKPNTAPDYFCTWNVQGFVCSYTNPFLQADAMIEANLFGKEKYQNWVAFYPDARNDLFLVLDDTWDIPLGGNRSHSLRGSMELDTQRFPSYQGTPAERFTKLNRDVQEHGWRGVGLWVCSSRSKERMYPDVNNEDYWKERMHWSKQAGINYWKVDWGSMGEMDLWRLNKWSHQAFPNLWIEHGGLDPTGGRMWLADKIDIFRTYDVAPVPSIPETIRRVAQVLSYPREDKSARGLINCEDEVYIGAALGCTYGVMRYPLSSQDGNKLPNGQLEPYFPAGFRGLKNRLDEVTRAVRWHRIAQPFGVGESELVDSVKLKFEPHKEKSNVAPARVARGGLPLPTVNMPEGQESPYVLCSRFPDGEIAVATIGRSVGKETSVRGQQVKDVAIPLADITLEVGALNRPVAIFDEYGSLTLTTNSKLKGKCILAQDLAGNTSVDITKEVKVENGRLTIPGAVIHRVGLMAAKPGDISDPGLVLAVQGLTKFIAKGPMIPALHSDKPTSIVNTGQGLKIIRAVWGPVYGGNDVTSLITGMVKDEGLKVEILPDVLGNNGTSNRYSRLELEYVINGMRKVILGVSGEMITIDTKGNYRTDRIPKRSN